MPRKTTKQELPPLDDMYQTWHIALRFRDGVAGMLMPTKGAAVRYAHLLQAGAGNELTAALKEHGVITPEDVAKFLEQNTQVFPLDEEGHHFLPHHVSAMLYQAGCKGNISGIKSGNPGAALSGAGHIVPPAIHFDPGYDVELGESPIHPTVGGKRTSAIAMYEVAHSVSLDFETKILRQPSHLPEDVYERLWHLAQQEGLGSMRKQSYGRFDLETCKPTT